MRADDVEPLVANPAGIGRILFAGEFLRQFVGDRRLRGHGKLPMGAASVSIAKFANACRILSCELRVGGTSAADLKFLSVCSGLL